MIRFECDYAEGAHPQILKRLIETNEEQTPGYGEDIHCEKAREYIRKACSAPDADVHFLVGGTQTNATVIASILKPHQGVLSVVSGHIAVHETGAVEAHGHKVITLPSDDGKLTEAQIEAVYQSHWQDANHEHVVQPGMIYISHPTENGTTYTLAELTAISAVCRSHNLPLFLDGARLGYGLASHGNDLPLPDIARLCDVFYLGGTKVGALFGEAVVITKDVLKQDFRYLMKQNGAMLAKGRLLGVQFETLFEDGLYFEISKHAVELAMMIREAFAAKGYAFKFNSVTNQQFPILPKDAVEKLNEKYASCFWEEAGDGLSVVRFCTSWATKREHVEMLIKDMQAL